MKSLFEYNRFLIFIFVLLIALPSLDAAFDIAPVKQLFEKRLAKKAPNLPKNFDEAKKYPRELEAYFNDNYGFRKSLIFANSQIMDKVFDESPDSRAVVGIDGWFYFDNHNSILDAMGRAKISDELVEKGVDAFYKNWQMFRKKGIKYLLIIAADKTSIYPEFLPDYIKASGPHRIDKFLNLLRKKYPNFPVLDLRPIMLNAKNREVIYHRTDTHWNRRGAHYAYLEIAKALKFKPYKRDQFEEISDEIIRGDISDIMNIAAEERNFDLKPKFEKNFFAIDPTPEEQNKFHRAVFFKNKNQNKNLPVIFIYQDSFYGDLSEFMAQHFYRSYEVNEFPCDINYEDIKKYHPNIVIQQFWEGRIEQVLNKCN